MWDSATDAVLRSMNEANAGTTGASGISARLLAARLRLLESHALVVREVVPSHPVQVRYSLSQSGSELVRVLIPLVPWGSRWGITAE
jgi:DNA-binding HxlR family transcriptional regulator